MLVLFVCIFISTIVVSAEIDDVILGTCDSKSGCLVAGTKLLVSVAWNVTRLIVGIVVNCFDLAMVSHYRHCKQYKDYYALPILIVTNYLIGFRDFDMNLNEYLLPPILIII